MTEYIVKSMFCFLVLYLGYIGLFRNSRNYQINRIVLLFSVLFALVVPVLEITPASLPIAGIERTGPVQKVLWYQNSLQGGETMNIIQNNSSADLPEIGFAVYMFVCVLLLARFIFNMSVLRWCWR